MDLLYVTFPFAERTYPLFLQAESLFWMLHEGIKMAVADILRCQRLTAFGVVLFYFNLNELSPIMVPSANMYTLYVPACRNSSTSQYAVTSCSSPVYSMYFLMEY